VSIRWPGSRPNESPVRRLPTPDAYADATQEADSGRVLEAVFLSFLNPLCYVILHNKVVPEWLMLIGFTNHAILSIDR